MEQMQVSRERGATGTTVIIRLRGPLTLATLHILEDALPQSGTADTVIDVGGAPYVDSAGLGTILAHWGKAQRDGCRFAICGVHPRIALLLEITRVNTILPTFASAEDADLRFVAERGITPARSAARA
ncbi:MAG TPA: STAS domain-containing protein [Bryobacteraceae bacterium]|jgi:anti-anti-sigma factor|nr:STAS domain-containing protein [Bryobacteraceae bacterium]